MIRKGRRRKKRAFTSDDVIDIVSDCIVESLQKLISLVLEHKATSRIGQNTYQHVFAAKEKSVEELVRDPAFIKSASYRVLRLQPGCGQKAVKAKFREMIMELRPDKASKDDINYREIRDKSIALHVARDTLLKFEI